MKFSQFTETMLWAQMKSEMSARVVRPLHSWNHPPQTSKTCCGVFCSSKQWVLLVTTYSNTRPPHICEAHHGRGPFIGFSRALQQEPEERQWCGKGLQGWMFFHLQSTLNVSFSKRSRAVGCWHGFFCVLVVKQVCPSLLICFLRCACYYYFSCTFLLFLLVRDFVFTFPKVTFFGTSEVQHFIRWEGKIAFCESAGGVELGFLNGGDSNPLETFG